MNTDAFIDLLSKQLQNQIHLKDMSLIEIFAFLVLISDGLQVYNSTSLCSTFKRQIENGYFQGTCQNKILFVLKSYLFTFIFPF